MDERLTFDHYRICRRDDGSRWELGRGAAGVTYKAEDVNLECPVALKVLNSTAFRNEETRAAFVQEAQAAANLRHRNIASVHHLGSDCESVFYAMEFIEGETVEALVKREGPLEPARALQIAAQVSKALAAAGRRGIVHGDIKPANLMITTDHADAEEGVLVKVIDFGMARSTQAGRPASRGFCGTPQYASPEQAEEGEVDGRSDIYSLGCTLWFLLTGKPPFTGSLANILVQRLHGEPFWQEVAGCPRGVRKLLRIMLRRNPAERPRDALEVQRAIEICLGAVERERSLRLRFVSSADQARRWMAAHPASRPAAVALIILLLATGAAMLPRDVANASAVSGAAGVVNAVAATVPGEQEPVVNSTAPTQLEEPSTAPENSATDPGNRAEPSSSEDVKRVATEDVAPVKRADLERTTPGATPPEIASREEDEERSGRAESAAKGQSGGRSSIQRHYYRSSSGHHSFRPLSHVHRAIRGLIGRLF